MENLPTIVRDDPKSRVLFNEGKTGIPPRFKVLDSGDLTLGVAPNGDVLLKRGKGHVILDLALLLEILNASPRIVNFISDLRVAGFLYPAETPVRAAAVKALDDSGFEKRQALALHIQRTTGYGDIQAMALASDMIRLGLVK